MLTIQHIVSEADELCILSTDQVRRRLGRLFRAISVFSNYFVFLSVFASSREKFLRRRVVESKGAGPAVNVYTGDGK